jgi:hypothetical protein
MDAARLARTNGIGRAALGAVMVAAPGLVARSWVGGDGNGPAASVIGRALGIRDVALGAGLLWAQSRDEPVHPWLVGAAAADTVDAAATLLSWDDLPPVGRAGVLALAVGSAMQMGVLAAVAGR